MEAVTQFVALEIDIGKKWEFFNAVCHSIRCIKD